MDKRTPLEVITDEFTGGFIQDLCSAAAFLIFAGGCIRLAWYLAEARAWEVLV